MSERLPNGTDLVGLVVGDLTVTKMLEERCERSQSRLWLCRCSCGEGEAIRSSGKLMHAFRRGLSMACSRCNAETGRGSRHVRRAAFREGLLALYAKEGTLYGRTWDEAAAIQIGDEVASQLGEEPFVEDDAPRDPRSLVLSPGAFFVGSEAEAGSTSQDWSSLFPRREPDHLFACGEPGCKALEESGWICVDCQVFLCRACVEKKESHRHGLKGSCKSPVESFDAVLPDLKRVSPTAPFKPVIRKKERVEIRLAGAEEPFENAEVPELRAPPEPRKEAFAATDPTAEPNCSTKDCSVWASHWIGWEVKRGRKVVPVKAPFCAYHAQKILASAGQ